MTAENWAEFDALPSAQKGRVLAMLSEAFGATIRELVPGEYDGDEFRRVWQRHYDAAFLAAIRPYRSLRRVASPPIKGVQR